MIVCGKKNKTHVFLEGQHTSEAFDADQNLLQHSVCALYSLLLRSSLFNLVTFAYKLKQCFLLVLVL